MNPGTMDERIARFTLEPTWSGWAIFDDGADTAIFESEEDQVTWFEVLEQIRMDDDPRTIDTEALHLFMKQNKLLRELQIS